MKANLALQLKSKETVRIILLDVAALLFIYFVPAISHMLKLPVYFIEPMRLALILALLHTTRRNAYVIALTLPIFSFLISAHPVLPKMLLITAELSLNVFLFYLFMKKMKSAPLAILLSIAGSKLFYYLVKFALINTAILATGLVGIPILMQVAMSLLFAGYAFLIFKKNKA
jgi:hypothetical protein